MAIGERIRFLRNLKGMTQKWLGMAVGFPERAADVRVGQYETGTRTPKNDVVENLAQALDVNSHALTVPDIDTPLGLAHTLFALEDLYGLKISQIDDQLCLRVEKDKEGKGHPDLDFFSEWYTVAQEYDSAQITLEAYNYWRYTYPRVPEEYAEALVQGEAHEGRPRALGLSCTWAHEPAGHGYIGNPTTRRTRR